MSTISKATIIENTMPIMQGDIYKNVKYSYIDSEDDSGVNVIEFEFPLAVIISQSCDAISMEQIINEHRGKPTKFMPSILLCPIYDKTIAKKGEHLFDAFSKMDLVLEKEDTYHSDDYNMNVNQNVSHSLI